MSRRENNALLREYASETLVIEPWGKDSLRVRSTMGPVLDEEDWALLPVESSEEPNISIGEDGRACIDNQRANHCPRRPERTSRLLQSSAEITR